MSDKVKVTVPSYGKLTEIDIDFNELRNTEANKIGYIHPNLEIQAHRILGNIQDRKHSIVLKSCELFNGCSYKIVDFIFDAIYDKAASKYEDEKCIGEPSIESFKDLRDDIYSLSCLGKNLLSIYLDTERLEAHIDDLKMTKKGILL